MNTGKYAIIMLTNQTKKADLDSDALLVDLVKDSNSNSNNNNVSQRIGADQCD